MPVPLNSQPDQMLSSGIAALAAAVQSPPQADPATAALAAVGQPQSVPQLAQPGGLSLMPLSLGLGSPGDAVGHALRPPDLHSLFPNMTARDLILKFTANTYGPGMAKALSARLGPMDDPVRLMAQKAIEQPSGNIPISGTTPPPQ
jgi:hypothetical protein